MISQKRENVGWEILLLASNQDAVSTARSLSIPAKNAIHFEATDVGIRKGFDDLARRVTELRESVMRAAA